MLKFGNKEFRNLQEQVKKNMDDILFILQEEGVLNEFGIKVVGQEDSVANMPTVADYKENNPDWSYGDAYAIGTEEPYELYILTRANGTHPNDYWFNIGEFPQPGPQGPAGADGEQGPQGEQGNPGVDGTSAGFGVISTTVTTLTPGSDATVSVVASGPDSSKNFAFSFGIPRGADGTVPTITVDWGSIGGTLSDQTDLVNALQGKQNTLVSGTNIKSINNQSLLGSGDITIDGKDNILNIGSSSTLTAEQISSLQADESLLIYANRGAYGKNLFTYKSTLSDVMYYDSVPTVTSSNVERITLNINTTTGQITQTVVNFEGGSTSLDIDATATATQVSPTVPASASVTVDTSGDTPILEFSFEIPQGEKGEQGIQGIQGIQGPEGPQGPTGATGPQGEQGIQGEQGPAGQDGADGADGQDGITPHIGANGDWYIGDTDTGVHAQGVQGPEGPQGPTGATGPAGQDGLTTEIIVNGQTYTQVSGVITLPDYPTVPSLATVATTGDYDDLLNKPTIPVVSANPTVTTGTLNSINIDGVGYSVPSGGGSVDAISVNGATYTPTSGVVTLPNYATFSGIRGAGIILGSIEANGSTFAVSQVENASVSTVSGASDLGSVEINGVTYNIPGAGTGPTNYVTTDTNQTITGRKYFNSSSPSMFATALRVIGANSVVQLQTATSTTTQNVNSFYFPNEGGTLARTVDINNGVLDIQVNGVSQGTFSANDNNSSTVNISVPTSSDYVALSGDQEVNGLKTFIAKTSNDSPVTVKAYNNQVHPKLTFKDVDNNTIGSIGQVVDTLSNRELGLINSNGATILLPSVTTTTRLGTENPSWNSILNKPNFATVATSGAYSDLSGTPSLATVATSGDYNDLLNKPTIPDISDCVKSIVVNGATYTPTSGSVNLGNIGGITSVTSTTETWTFTLSDNSTVTKTIVTGVTAS